MVNFFKQMKAYLKENISKVNIWMFKHRYPVFFTSLLLFFVLPDIFRAIFDTSPHFMSLFSLVVFSSIFLVQVSRRSFLFTIALVLFLLVLNILITEFEESRSHNMILFLLLFVYFLWITVFLFRDLMNNKSVTWQTIVGAFSGYFLIGVLGFFLFAFIEIEASGSFSVQVHSLNDIQQLFYLSFITMTTIGYGDILPVTDSARSAAILIGLVGQFYLAIVMAIMVGKFISRPQTDETKQ